jgi:hypothetical protein
MATKKNKRARRAEQHKARSERVRNGAPSGGASERSAFRLPPQQPPVDVVQVVDTVIEAAVMAHRNGRALPPSRFDSLAQLDRRAVDGEIERTLLHLVAQLWSAGWQPAELQRQGRRAGGKAGGGLLAMAIAADHAGRRATTLDHRWTAQIDTLDLPSTDGRPGWFRRWVAEQRAERSGALATAIGTVADLFSLPPLEELIPPPGAQRTARSADGGADVDPILQRIRALLAKAESTTFEAEADAFTTKAQELMARHAIDAAVVASGHQSDEAPASIRIPIDDPYADPKAALLHHVSEAGRCRTVYSPSVGLATVVGFAAELGGVELLFTSLLVQAQSALANAARNAPPGTRTRSRGYRSSFLLSFAVRIGGRLQEVNRQVMSEAKAEQGDSFLPALRARDEAVDDTVEDLFGGTLTKRPWRGGTDAAGWASGQVAADNARLTAADLERC